MTKKEIIHKLMQLEEIEDSMIMYMNNSIKNPINVSTLDIHDIIAIVCSIVKVNASLVTKKTREREVVEARHFIFYFARRITNYSLKTIGKEFKRDHTTVIHGIDNVRKFISTPGYETQQEIHSILCEVFNLNIKEDIERAAMMEKQNTSTSEYMRKVRLQRGKQKYVKVNSVLEPVYVTPSYARPKADHTNTNWQTKYAEAI